LLLAVSPNQGLLKMVTKWVMATAMRMVGKEEGNGNGGQQQGQQ
jgi:hypothetical protein